MWCNNSWMEKRFCLSYIYKNFKTRTKRKKTIQTNAQNLSLRNKSPGFFFSGRVTCLLCFVFPVLPGVVVRFGSDTRRGVEIPTPCNTILDIFSFSFFLYIYNLWGLVYHTKSHTASHGWNRLWTSQVPDARGARGRRGTKATSIFHRHPYTSTHTHPHTIG